MVRGLKPGLIAFIKTFPNMAAYPSFSAHPNYKLLGPVYSYFYMARPMFFTWIFYRMTRFLYSMVWRHYTGQDDLHSTWYWDTLYPDMIFDADDMRYINFRYTDQKVVPDDLTGYYPYDSLKYQTWLDRKQ
jgi:hypothetical protein